MGASSPSVNYTKAKREIHFSVCGWRKFDAKILIVLSKQIPKMFVFRSILHGV